MKTICKARFRPGSEYRCERCDLTWDSDDNAPDCLTAQEIAHNAIDKSLTKSTSPTRLIDITYNNSALIVSFNHGKFKGVNLLQCSDAKTVVSKLRMLANLIEEDVI